MREPRGALSASGGIRRGPMGARVRLGCVVEQADVQTTTHITANRVSNFMRDWKATALGAGLTAYLAWVARAALSVLASSAVEDLPQ